MRTKRYVAKDFNASSLVSELACQTGTLPSNALGVLYCDSTLDCDEIASRLHDALGITIVGGTAMAFINDGISAELVVFSGEGLFSCAGISEPLGDDCEEKICALYNDCLSSLGCQPKIIQLFVPHNKYNDLYVNEVYKYAGDIPVIGGIHGNDLVDSTAFVYMNDTIGDDRIALAMFGGDIKPIFTVISETTQISEYYPMVTLARGNKLYEVDNMPVCDYLKTMGMNVLPGDTYQEYGQLHFEEPGVPPELTQSRSILRVSEDESCITLTGYVPVPSRVGVSILTKENISSSAKKCIDELKHMIAEGEKDGYEYSTILCLPCVSRYIAFIGSDNFEKALLNQELPGAAGFYAFGEIGPLVHDGKIYNRFNNASIVICAI